MCKAGLNFGAVACSPRRTIKIHHAPTMCYNQDAARFRSIPGATIGPATQTISTAARSLVSDVELTVFPAVFTANAGAAVGMLMLQTLGIGNYSVFGSVVTTCSVAPAQMTGPSGEMVHDVKARCTCPACLANMSPSSIPACRGIDRHDSLAMQAPSDYVLSRTRCK